MRSGETAPQKRGFWTPATVQGSLLSAGVLLALALLGLVNYLGFKYHARWDWTRSQLFSLSEQSENVLAKLDREVEVVSFITPDSALYEPTRELLDRYQAASSRLRVRWLDPQRNPVEVQKLAEQFQLTTAGVVFRAGEDRRVVAADKLAELDFSAVAQGGQPSIGAYRGEELFTSALVALTAGDKPRVLFTSGHGERALDDTGQAGLRAFQDLLGRDNVALEEWRTLGASAVPEGADLVVIAGPTAPFVAAELDLLGQFLARGGRLLVLLDPAFGPGTSGLVATGLEPWLATYGVKVGPNVVVDPAAALPGFGAETFFPSQYGAHAMTRSLQSGGIPLLVREARSVAAGTAPAGYRALELVSTTRDAWGITRFVGAPATGPEEGDPRGPLGLAVVVEPTPPAGGDDHGHEAPTAPPAAADPNSFRLVVVGDSDFLTAAFLNAGPGNPVLANNLVNWLAERETLLGIPPKRPEQVRLSMTPGELRWGMVLTVLLFPALAVTAGVWVTVRRRRTT